MNDNTTEACSSKLVDYVLANWELIRMRKTIDDAFADFDVVVLPTTRRCLLEPLRSSASLLPHLQHARRRREPDSGWR